MIYNSGDVIEFQGEKMTIENVINIDFDVVGLKCVYFDINESLHRPFIVTDLHKIHPNLRLVKSAQKVKYDA